MIIRFSSRYRIYIPPNDKLKHRLNQMGVKIGEKSQQRRSPADWTQYPNCSEPNRSKVSQKDSSHSCLGNN